MKKKFPSDQKRLYLGVDIGGTKVQASLVRESGEIIGRERCPTPRNAGPEQEVAAIEKCMDDMVRKGGISPNDLTAIGIAVPGVVDPDRGLVVVAPNMQLTGVCRWPSAGSPFQSAHHHRQRRQPRCVGRNMAWLRPQSGKRIVYLRGNRHRQRFRATWQAVARRSRIGR